MPSASLDRHFANGASPLLLGAQNGATRPGEETGLDQLVRSGD